MRKFKSGGVMKNMNKKEKLMDKKISVSDEATKTNEEIIKYKNVLVESGLGENDRVTSGQVQAPQIPEMELIKEDYHPIKFIIEMVKSIFSNKRTN